MSAIGREARVHDAWEQNVVLGELCSPLYKGFEAIQNLLEEVLWRCESVFGEMKWCISRYFLRCR